MGIEGNPMTMDCGKYNKNITKKDLVIWFFHDSRHENDIMSGNITITNLPIRMLLLYNNLLYCYNNLL